jgi:hypothetical protein
MEGVSRRYAEGTEGLLSSERIGRSAGLEWGQGRSDHHTTPLGSSTCSYRARRGRPDRPSSPSPESAPGQTCRVSGCIVRAGPRVPFHHQRTPSVQSSFVPTRVERNEDEPCAVADSSRTHRPRGARAPYLSTILMMLTAMEVPGRADGDRLGERRCVSDEVGSTGCPSKIEREKLL